ncbi:MAG: shikimate kinase [Panacibacter sp.]
MKNNFTANLKYFTLKGGGHSSPLGAGGRIFLIGMMGTGKSYWAQRIADVHKMDWTDLDAQIEKETLMTIKEIFETQGETYFRSKEKETLHKLTSLKNIVIATGGGTPCFHENMQWMNKHGVSIWIDEPVEVLAERLKKEKAHRPLIKDLTDEELLHFLSIKLSERSKFYSQSQHH